jgi:hypothetical protein
MTFARCSVNRHHRLLLERERAAAQARDADMKWKRKIITGLETLTKYAAKHPKAQAALAELARQSLPAVVGAPSIGSE